MAVSIQTILNRVYYNLGVVSLGDPLTPFQSTDGLARANVLVDAWALQTQISTFISRNVFNVIANQGLYTLGPGGDLNTPIVPVTLTGAGLIYTAGGSIPTEIPRGVLTDDAWRAVPQKSLTSQYFTDVYLQWTYASVFASVNLWPVPTDGTIQLTLYWRDLLPGFATVTQTYNLPHGYERALEYNLALELLPEYEVPVDMQDRIEKRAQATLREIKRTYGTRLVDLPQDPALAPSNRGGYNILTGQGGGSY